MLRECHAPMNVFDLVPTLRLEPDPVLAQLDHLLDDDTLFQAVKADLAQRRPRTLLDGRPSTPVEVIWHCQITVGEFDSAVRSPESSQWVHCRTDIDEPLYHTTCCVMQRRFYCAT